MSIKPKLANDIEETLHRAEVLCEQNGGKLTPKRRHVLSTLIKQNKALSAYDVADKMREESGTAPPTMSVYRILDFLASQNLVHKLSLANKYVACSHINCQHSHRVPQFLICQECSEVKEIGIDPSIIEALRENISSATFHLTSPQLEMNCLCDACFSASTH